MLTKFQTENHDRTVIPPTEMFSPKYAGVYDESGIGECTEQQQAVPSLELYDGAVGTDAKFNQTHSEGFLKDYEEHTCRVRGLHERRGGCFSQLIVSELLPPFLLDFLSRVFIGIDCDVSDSEPFDGAGEAWR